MRSGTEQQIAPQIIAKVTAHIAEENFWGYSSLSNLKLNVIFFVADNEFKIADFDVLAILPEINETLKLQQCQTAPSIVTSGSGKSNKSSVQPQQYLTDEMSRFSGFIAHAKRFETLIRIPTDPETVFEADLSFRAKRVAQIKSALGSLVPERPLAIRVAYFSRFTDQINVLVPSRLAMFTMSVVHDSCSDESVEVGRQLSLKSIRPDLRRKIDLYNIAAAILLSRKAPSQR